MTTLSFTVPGRPVPAVRATQRSKHVDPRYHKYAAYKSWVAIHAKKAMVQQKFLYVPEKMPIDFKAVATLATKHKIDVDNILKSLLDGLNGVAWYDDCQVMSAYISKEFVSKKEDEKVVIYINTL